MILKVFAVRDMKAEAFLQPFYSPSVGSAVRAFTDAVNDKNCPFNKHPRDYVLYEIGEYDDATGGLASLELVKMYMAGSDVIELKPEIDYSKAMYPDKAVALAELDGKK